MRIPRHDGLRAIRLAIRGNLSSYTLERPDGNIGALGESRNSVTNPSVDLWLFSPQEVSLETPIGERLTGSLNGLTLPTEDIREGDMLTFDGEKYRVAEVFDKPQGNPKITVIDLERQTNEQQ